MLDHQERCGGKEVLDPSRFGRSRPARGRGQGRVGFHFEKGFPDSEGLRDSASGYSRGVCCGHLHAGRVLAGSHRNRQQEQKAQEVRLAQCQEVDGKPRRSDSQIEGVQGHR